MKSMNRKTLALLCGILMLIGSAFAESGKVSTENGGSLNMRKEPDQKSKIVTKVKNGSLLNVLELSDGLPEGWLHVAYGGKEGFVQSQFVKMISSAIGQEIYSNGNTLYLRESPDENAAIVGMLNAQQGMSLEEVDDHWALVSNKSVKGYVRIEQIDNLNDHPVAAATQKWEEGVLQKETNLYKEPDKNAEIISTQNKGIGVAISQYNSRWCLVQILDSQIIGFVPAASIKLTPMEKNTDKIDDSKFTVSASGAKKTAEKALKQFSGFNASHYTCRQETMYSCDGIVGPLYRFIYLNKQGQMIYAAYIHCYTGEVLYKGDYSSFVYDKNIADIKTAPPPAPTPEPIPAYDENGNLLTEINLAEPAPTPEHMEGTPMSEQEARSIADRFLSAKYPRFSEMSFSKVTCRYDDTPSNLNRTPVYVFYYFCSVDEEDVVQYGCGVHAILGEIEGYSGPGEGQG